MFGQYLKDIFVPIIMFYNLNNFTCVKHCKGEYLFLNTSYEYFCSTTNSTCGLNQGDCDASDECIIGLVCGTDNCGNATSLDCCYNATIGAPLAGETINLKILEDARNTLAVS